jgi:hypothetical protein
LRLRNAASISRVSRSVAQPGRAPRSGRGGRRFKSCRSDQFFPKTNIVPPILPPIQRGTLAEHSRRRTSPAASGIQSHALSHDAAASMRTRSPLGITSVRGFECTAHSPTVGLNCESTCRPKTLTVGGVTFAAPVPTVTPRAMSALVHFRDVGCPRRCNRLTMRASDRAGRTFTRRRDPRR